MNFSIKILEKNSDIQQKIYGALILQADNFMKKSIDNIKQSLPNIVQSSIINSPEYFALINGNLRLELGIPNPISKVIGLLDIWMSNIVYQYDKPRVASKGLYSKFSAKMIRSNFDDVLSTEFSIVRDNQRGYELPWLKWLLLDGTKSLVDNYGVVFGPSKYSRTGYAIMRSGSRSWGIPNEFAGTQNDNWITRAIDGASPEIINLLNRSFKL